MDYYDNSINDFEDTISILINTIDDVFKDFCDDDRYNIYI